MARGVPNLDELLAAYAEGWFPMDIHGQVGFYECDPRAIIPLDGGNMAMNAGGTPGHEGRPVQSFRADTT